MTLAERVSDALSGVALLLVFVIALFDLSYMQIRAALEARMPGEDRPVERRKHKAELRAVLMRRALPPAIVNAVVVYALAPLSQDVIAGTDLKVWDFNELLTIYVLLYALTAAFAVWSVLLVVRLVGKIVRTA